MANLVRWDPFRDLVDMDRLMDRVLRGGDVRRRSQALEQGVKTPALDVYDKKDKIVVKAELPGMDPKDIEITLHDNVLTMRGERKQEKEQKEENYHRVERSYGSFVRSFRLPADVESEKVDAAYKDGILTVKLKKSAKGAAKKIEIKTG